MGKIISVTLQKGGIGKTTTSQALASTLGFKGYKVLLIDLDPQGNLTYSTGVDDIHNTIFDVIAESCAITESLHQCKYYTLIPYDLRLANIEMLEDFNPCLLRNLLEPIKDNYDYIVIDTPPALGNLSFSSLVASDFVLVPCEPCPFALQGLGELNRTIQTIKDQVNPKLRVLGILLIKYNNRTNLTKVITNMLDETSKDMNTTLFDTTIRNGVAVAEAQAMRTDLIDYAKNSKPNIDYKSFTTELLKRIGDI